jgi:hypothetical protein
MTLSYDKRYKHFSLPITEENKKKKMNKIRDKRSLVKSDIKVSLVSPGTAVIGMKVYL